MTDEKKTFLKGRTRKPGRSEIDDCRAWLENLGFQSPPKLHINGPQHPTAAVVVDFGTPLNEPMRMTAEQSAELIGYIRSNTKSLYRDRDVSVRVQSDSNTGIWWASVG